MCSAFKWATGWLWSLAYLAGPTLLPGDSLAWELLPCHANIGVQVQSFALSFGASDGAASKAHNYLRGQAAAALAYRC